MHSKQRTQPIKSKRRQLVSASADGQTALKVFRHESSRGMRYELLYSVSNSKFD